MPRVARGHDGVPAVKGHSCSSVHRPLVVGKRAERTQATGATAVADRGGGDPRSNAGAMDVQLLLVTKKVQPTSEQRAAIPGNAVRLRQGIVPRQDGHAARSPAHNRRSRGEGFPFVR